MHLFVGNSELSRLRSQVELVNERWKKYCRCLNAIFCTTEWKNMVDVFEGCDDVFVYMELQGDFKHGIKSLYNQAIRKWKTTLFIVGTKIGRLNSGDGIGGVTLLVFVLGC